MPTLEFIQK